MAQVQTITLNRVFRKDNAIRISNQEQLLNLVTKLQTNQFLFYVIHEKIKTLFSSLELPKDCLNLIAEYADVKHPNNFASSVLFMNIRFTPEIVQQMNEIYSWPPCIFVTCSFESALFRKMNNITLRLPMEFQKGSWAQITEGDRLELHIEVPVSRDMLGHDCVNMLKELKADCFLIIEGYFRVPPDEMLRGLEDQKLACIEWRKCILKKSITTQNALNATKSMRLTDCKIDPEVLNSPSVADIRIEKCGEIPKDSAFWLNLRSKRFQCSMDTFGKELANADFLIHAILSRNDVVEYLGLSHIQNHQKFMSMLSRVLLKRHHLQKLLLSFKGAVKNTLNWEKLARVMQEPTSLQRVKIELRCDVSVIVQIMETMSRYNVCIETFKFKVFNIKESGVNNIEDQISSSIKKRFKVNVKEPITIRFSRLDAS